MVEQYSRPIDFGSRTWISYEKQGLQPSFLLTVEGLGGFSNQDVNDALQKLSIAYPICRSVLTGCLKSLRWQETSIFPRYEDMGSTAASFCDWPLPEEKTIYAKRLRIKKESPLAVFSLHDGSKTRIYFKIHHASMDGVGMHLLLEDFFKLLRGEAPDGPSKGYETLETKEKFFDTVLPDAFFKERRRQYKQKAKQPKPDKEGSAFFFNGAYIGKHLITPSSKENDYQWCSLLIPRGTVDFSRLNGKLLSCFINVFKQITPGIEKKRFQAFVPVDLRYLLPGLRTASNLSGLTAIELDKYIDMPQWKAVSKIMGDIKSIEKNHLAAVRLPAILDWMPIWVMSSLGFIFTKTADFFRKSPYYFFYSNVGRLSVQNFSTRDFTAQRVFLVPNTQFYCPLFVIVITHENGIEIVCATDTDKSGLAALIDPLKTELNSVDENTEADQAFSI